MGLPWVAVRFDLVLPAQQVNMPSTQPRWLVPNDNAWNSYKISRIFGANCPGSTVLGSLSCPATSTHRHLMLCGVVLWAFV